MFADTRKAAPCQSFLRPFFFFEEEEVELGCGGLGGGGGGNLLEVKES